MPSYAPFLAAGSEKFSRTTAADLTAAYVSSFKMPLETDRSFLVFSTDTTCSLLVTLAKGTYCSFANDIFIEN